MGRGSAKDLYSASQKRQRLGIRIGSESLLDLENKSRIEIVLESASPSHLLTLRSSAATIKSDPHLGSRHQMLLRFDPFNYCIQFRVFSAFLHVYSHLLLSASSFCCSACIESILDIRFPSRPSSPPLFLASVPPISDPRAIDTQGALFHGQCKSSRHRSTIPGFPDIIPATVRAPQRWNSQLMQGASRSRTVTCSSTTMTRSIATAAPMSSSSPARVPTRSRARSRWPTIVRSLTFRRLGPHGGSLLMRGDEQIN